DLGALQQRVQSRLKLVSFLAAQRVREFLEPGQASGDDPLGELPSLGGQCQAPDPPVIGVLDPGGELLADQSLGRARGGSGGDPELLGQSGHGAGVLVRRLELDEHLHLGEGESALVDHPEHIAAAAAHAAEQERPQLDRQLAGGPFCTRRRPLSRSCFHYGKGYTLATFSKPQRSVRRVTQESRGRWAAGVHPAPSICWPPAMEDAARLDHDDLWHPFTQQRDWVAEEPLMIEAAEGNELIDTEGRRYLDGVSSLWCNVHGHRHPEIDSAVREQLDRVAHSTMLGLSHPPAAELAGRLVEIAPPGLNRVFYSDSGSTAVEVALKMAFQYWQHRGGQHVRKTGFISLEGGYHGDTLGSVSVGGMPLFHSTFEPLLFQSHRVEPGNVEEIGRLLALREEEVAAVVMEPLVQGAAGMVTHPAGYLRAVQQLCDRHGTLLICDEVATGFG